MQEFTTVELLRDSKTVTMAADKHPVAITQHRKPRYVLMTFEDFNTLNNRSSDTRKVFGAHETPEEIANLILPELDKLIAESEGDK